MTVNYLPIIELVRRFKIRDFKLDSYLAKFRTGRITEKELRELELYWASKFHRVIKEATAFLGCPPEGKPDIIFGIDPLYKRWVGFLKEQLQAILLIGIPGSGKTALAMLLSSQIMRLMKDTRMFMVDFEKAGMRLIKLIVEPHGIPVRLLNKSTTRVNPFQRRPGQDETAKARQLLPVFSESYNVSSGGASQLFLNKAIRKTLAKYEMPTIHDFLSVACSLEVPNDTEMRRARYLVVDKTEGLILTTDKVLDCETGITGDRLVANHNVLELREYETFPQEFLMNYFITEIYGELVSSFEAGDHKNVLMMLDDAVFYTDTAQAKENWKRPR